MHTIELIVPCYNEEECIKLFYERICEVFSSDRLKDYDFTITYIDDGSKDDTMGEVKNVVKTHEESLSSGKNSKGRIQYISLSRNFGKEAAMYAGLKKASGDYVCVLDADELPGDAVELRTRREGDYIMLSVGTKMIQDLFVDMKVPRHMRDDVYMATIGSEVLWIPDANGRERFTEKYGVSSLTKRVLLLEIDK